MKILSDDIKITYNGSSLHQERQSQLTINLATISGSGATRGSKAIAELHSWDVKGELLCSFSEFSFFMSMIRAGGMPQMAFSCSIAGEAVTVEGGVVITSCRITANRGNLVTLQFSAVGAGKPTLTSETGQNLVLTADPYYILTADNYFIKAI